MERYQREPNQNDPRRVIAWVVSIFAILIVLGIFIFDWGRGPETSELTNAPGSATNPEALDPVQPGIGMGESEETATTDPHRTASDDLSDSGVSTHLVGTSSGEGAEDANNINPEEMLGQTVKVRGDVNRVMEDTAFTMDGSSFANSDEILVIHQSPNRPILQEGDQVVVEGTVRMLDEQFVQELDEVIRSSSLEDYENQPVIIAGGAAPRN